MAKGPGGKEVGRVSVRVVPDTSGFAEELKAELAALEKSLKVHIPVDLDTKSVAAEAAKVATEVKTIEQAASTTVENTKREFSSLRKEMSKVHISGEEFFPQNGIDRAVKRFTTGFKSITRSAKNSGRAIRDAFKAPQMPKGVVNVAETIVASIARDVAGAANAAKVSFQQFGKAAKAAGRGALKAVGGLARFRSGATAIYGVNKALGAVRQSFDSISGRAKRTGQEIKSAFRAARVTKEDFLNPSVIKGMKRDFAGVAAVAALGFRKVGNTLKGATRSLGKATKGFGRFAKGVARPSNLLRVFASPLKLASKGVRKLGGVLGKGVKGFMKLSRGMKIAVGVAALIAPAIGLVSGLIAGLPSLLAAAGAGFAAVKLGMDGIKAAAKTLDPQIKKLKASLSTTFEKGLTPIFKRLRGVFPVLQKGLNQVAKGMIPLASRFTDVVTSAQGMKVIGSILQNTGRFFTALQPMVVTFTQSFLTLANAGSKQLGLLAGVLNNFGNEWRAMVDRIVGNGDFQKAIAGLASVTGALLHLFTQLFGAGVKALGQMAGPMSAFINGFTNAVVGLMPTLTALSNMLFQILTPALNVIGSVFRALAPSITAIGNLFGTLFASSIRAITPILNVLAQILNTVLLQALRAIQPILPPLIQFWMQMGKIISTFLLQAFQAITPLLTLVAQFIRQILQAITPLLPVMLQLGKAVLNAVLIALRAIIPPLLSLANRLFPIVLQLVRALAPAFISIVKAITPLLAPIGRLVGALAQALVPVFQLVLDVVEAVWPNIKGIIKGVTDVIIGIVKVFSGILKGDWSQVWDGVKQILRGAVGIIKNLVMGLINGIVSFFSSLPGRVWQVLKGIWQVGKNLVIGIWNGLVGMAGWLWNKVKRFCQNIWHGILNFFGIHSPSRLMRDTVGVMLAKGVGSGIEKGTGSAVDAAAKMSKKVAAAAQVSDWMTDAVVTDMASPATQRVFGDFQAQVKADNFGDRVTEALEGWKVELDPSGVARLNKIGSVRRARRG